MPPPLPPFPAGEVLPRRLLAHQAVQWLALGMGFHSARPAHAQFSGSSGQAQWLPGHALQAEDAADLEWLRFDGDQLRMRARSFRRPALWVAADLGATALPAPRRLRQLRWSSRLQVGLQWRSLTLRDGPTVCALIEGAPLAAQHLDWPFGLVVQQGLMLRWELEADAQYRELVWQDIQLTWM